MPIRTIAEIEKSISEKQKVAIKNKKDLPLVRKEVKRLATEKEELDDLVKAEKDKKKKGELEKKRDVIIKEYEPVKAKLVLMEKTELTIVETISTLEAELEKVNEGVASYGEARKAGVLMLATEGKKIRAAHEKCQLASKDAEDASRLAEASTKKGDTNAALGARNMASDALVRTQSAQRLVKSLVESVTTKMTATQRNLKAADFEVADKDVLVHNVLTKRVQDDFKALEALVADSEELVAVAEKSSIEATEFAEASGTGKELYEKILNKGLQDLKAGMSSIESTMGAKWGGYITNKGELFERLLSNYQTKPNDVSVKAACDKTIEQGQTFLETTMNKVDTIAKQMVLVSNKATQRVPEEYKRALKSTVDQVRMAAMQILTAQKKAKTNFDITLQKFNELKSAIGR